MSDLSRHLHKIESDYRTEISRNVVQLFVGSTDPGDDPDDILQAAASAFFVRTSVNVMGSITDRGNAWLRARLEKGALGLLDLGKVSVAVGSNYAPGKGPEHPLAKSIIERGEDAFPKGVELLHGVLRFAFPRSLSLLLIGGTFDMFNVAVLCPDLVQKNVARFGIMGGVEVKEGKVVLDDEGMFQAEQSAANNKFHYPSAWALYRTIQMWGIPMTIFTRHAAKALAFPPGFYDECAATGHPVAVYLRDFQSAIINHLWWRTWQTGEAREELPDRCTPKWFAGFFCGDDGLSSSIGPNDDIWPFIKELAPYDVGAFLALDERISKDLFSPEIVYVRGAAHSIVGVTLENHGVKDPTIAKEYVQSVILGGFKKTVDYAKAQLEVA